MDYQHYSTEDFIKDEAFQEWVFLPTAQTEILWANVLQNFPEKRKSIYEAKQFLQVFNGKSDDVFESRLTNLKRRVNHAIDNGPLQVEDTISVAEKKITHHTLLYKKLFWAAAAVGIMVLVAASLFQEIESKTLPWFAGSAKQQQQQITPKGQRTVVTLEDGTKVWLNADSRLDYPKSFKGSPTREVYLEGEGFFDVSENKDQPFIVQTSDLKIKVLGTSFNVKSYQGDKNIETTLVRGKVTIQELQEENRPVTLLPNQQAVFEKKSKMIVLENRVNTESYTSWKDGNLQFDDQPLNLIIQELERWYNVSIEVDDESSLSCRFSANVNNKTLEEVLELFKASESIDYTIAGREVFIRGKLCGE